MDYTSPADLCQWAEQQLNRKTDVYKRQVYDSGRNAQNKLQAYTEH